MYTEHCENTLRIKAINENGHTPRDFSFAPIDKVEAEWPRLLKETYWVHRLNTIHPNGMNSKVLYQIP